MRKVGGSEVGFCWMRGVEGAKKVANAAKVCLNILEKLEVRPDERKVSGR